MADVNRNKFSNNLQCLLVIGGIIGTIASFIILNDKLQLLQNSGYVPSCSINPILSCGSVMKSTQAEVFGFSNPIIGLISFPVLITVGVSMLAGARFKKWFWLGLEAGGVFGIGFMHWLFYQSVFRIQALCIYCLAVWAITIPIFWYLTLHNIAQGNLKIPKPLARVAGFMQRHHADILIVWYLIIAGLILNHFWYYLKTIL